jgi:hypothetical protein
MIDQVWLPFVLLAVLASAIAFGLGRIGALQPTDRRARWARALAFAPILVLVILNNR